MEKAKHTPAEPVRTTSVLATSPDYLPHGAYITLAKARTFLPRLQNNNSLRVWLNRRPHIRRKHGHVVLSDFLKELQNG